MEDYGIGGMDTLVELQSCSVGIGAQGQKTYAYTRHSDVFAKVEADTDESVSNGNLEAGETRSVTIYKVEGLTTRWRVVIAGKPYAVTYIDAVSRVSPVCKLTLTSISETL